MATCKGVNRCNGLRAALVALRRRGVGPFDIVVLGQIVEHYGKVWLIDLRHILFLDHPAQKSQPAPAGHPLLGDDLLGVAAGAIRIGFLDARRIDEKAEFRFLILRNTCRGNKRGSEKNDKTHITT